MVVANPIYDRTDGDSPVLNHFPKNIVNTPHRKPHRKTVPLLKKSSLFRTPYTHTTPHHTVHMHVWFWPTLVYLVCSCSWTQDEPLLQNHAHVLPCSYHALLKATRYPLCRGKTNRIDFDIKPAVAATFIVAENRVPRTRLRTSGPK
jgi:hypothetical protein